MHDKCVYYKVAAVKEPSYHLLGKISEGLETCFRGHESPESMELSFQFLVGHHGLIADLQQHGSKGSIISFSLLSVNSPS